MRKSPQTFHFIPLGVHFVNGVCCMHSTFSSHLHFHTPINALTFSPQGPMGPPGPVGDPGGPGQRGNTWENGEVTLLYMYNHIYLGFQKGQGG